VLESAISLPKFALRAPVLETQLLEAEDSVDCWRAGALRVLSPTISASRLRPRCGSACATTSSALILASDSLAASRSVRNSAWATMSSASAARRFARSSLRVRNIWSKRAPRASASSDASSQAAAACANNTFNRWTFAVATLASSL